MCGIAGWIDWSTERVDVSVLDRMNDALAHRGPDGAGRHLARTRDGQCEVALAHRRLAIIDLASGAQPMRSRDGSVTIVYNGEIYNFQELRAELRALGHEFRTASDTEVIINGYLAWGVDGVAKLRGMFAFALWDSRTEQLLLARDHFGKKPLFLHQQGRRLLFASEIKSLLRHPAVVAEADPQSVLDYLQYRYVPGPPTLFRSVVKLPPGSYAVWRRGELGTHSYFLPPDGRERASGGKLEADPVAGFLAQLEDSVRLRMIADVPYGAFLSGGIDSSSIVALMSRQSQQPINTFSVGFREAEYSELRYARMVAERFRTNHHELMVAPEDIIALLPKAIAHRDAPVAETADVPIYMLALEAAKSVKMVLTGEGADEILGGYPKHAAEPYVAAYQALVPGIVHRRLIAPLAAALPFRFQRWCVLANSIGLRGREERLPRWFGAIDLAERAHLSSFVAPPRAVGRRPFAVVGNPSALRRILYFDQTSWLPDNLLERGDRMTMAASIEARMPFMDHQLATWISRWPDRYRIRRGRRKWLLRRAMQRILPAEIVTRAKIGFRVPVDLWFQTSLRDFVHDHLLGPRSRTGGYYRREVLTRLLEEHVGGRRNHEKLIWSLLNLELFYQSYRLC